jgi:hypothetical protein
MSRDKDNKDNVCSTTIDAEALQGQAVAIHLKQLLQGSAAA